MIKVLLVGNSIEPNSFGGVNNFLKLFLQNFSDKNIKIDYFSLGRSPNWFKGKSKDSKFKYMVKQLTTIPYNFLDKIRKKNIGIVHFFPLYQLIILEYFSSLS